MRIVLVARHRKSVDPYVGFLREAGRRGHNIVVTLQERDEKISRTLGGIAGLTVAPFPHQRRDEWRDTAIALRTARDYLQYLLPPYARARKLRARALQRLFDQLNVDLDARDESLADGGLQLPAATARRLAEIASMIERSVPPDDPHVAFLQQHRPDVVLVTPLVHFGSAQAEFVKAAQAIGVPVGMHVFSWDNLSTKGAMHVAPDRVFAWNETQRRELLDLHSYPGDRVDLVGAPRFDEFALMQPTLDRDAFDRSLGFDSTRPTVLYVCSSKLVSAREARFVREWVQVIRSADAINVREANLLIRPHPDVPELEPRWITAERDVHWPESDAELRVCELFGQPRTLFARSDRGSVRTLYEMLAHSTLVVGLNTSAEIEAGILGRPVLTVLADERVADGQHATLHFHYLRESEGGFVRVAEGLQDHVRDLEDVMTRPPSAERIRERVQAFIRPLGWHVPAALALTDAVERLARMQPVRVARRADSVAVHDEVFSAGTCILGQQISIPTTIAADAVTRAQRDAAALVPHAAAGDVIFEVGAGFGLVAIALAKARGTTGYVFESAIPSLNVVWSLVRQNACDGAIAPLALFPGARTMLRQDTLESALAGATRSTPRRHQWREHDSGWTPEVTQPVLAMPLDQAAKLWSLSMPRVLRLAAGDATVECLEGARGLLTSEALRAVLVDAPAAHVTGAHKLLSTMGWELTESLAGEVVTLWTRPSR